MFITFEGVEGSGKSTALKGLAHYLESAGHEVICTREPGGSALGRELRKTLLDKHSNICPSSELFLFLADRAQHIHDIIMPALKKGSFVLCDRYVDSTIAYQGAGRGLEIDTLLNLHTICTNDLWPHLTLLIDVPTQVGLERAMQRNSQNAENNKELRFDTESLSFHEMVRQGYMNCAMQYKERFAIINGLNTPEMVLDDCIKTVQQKFNLVDTKKV